MYSEKNDSKICNFGIKVVCFPGNILWGLDIVSQRVPWKTNYCAKMAHLGIIFLRISYLIHWYLLLHPHIVGSMPFCFFSGPPCILNLHLLGCESGRKWGLFNFILLPPTQALPPALPPPPPHSLNPGSATLCWYMYMYYQIKSSSTGYVVT